MAQADFTRISSNIAALNTLNSLRNINTKLGKAQLRLATGKRINQAADDPAGLTIALKMNARNEGLKAALSNIGDAKNMLAVGESGLQQISDILTEMKAKTTAAASETLGDSERLAIKNQLQSLAKQINDIVDETQWNDSVLLDGGVSQGLSSMSKTLQTGAGATDTTTWTVDANHKATGDLNLASAAGTGAVFASVATTGASFAVTASGNGTITAGVTGMDAFSGLAELDSGTYKFRVADKASTAATAKASLLNTETGIDSFVGTDDGASTALSSGHYTLTIDDVAAGGLTISYTITDSLGNIKATYDNLNTDAATALKDTNGNDLGIEIQTDDGTIAAGDFHFEYIDANEVKVELYQVNGTSENLVAVDASGGTADGVATQSFFYVDASSASYNTGVGLKVDLSGTWADIKVGDSAQFAYTQAGDLTVNLSNAQEASNYMGTLDTAIQTVSSSLNSIGSLVARLDAKEQSVGSAQVNTEAAYNRIMNADMAFEQVEAAKYMILQQTAVAMLAQANMAPQGILSLFR